jgi:hypothetical protein
VDANTLPTSRKKSSDVWEGGKNVGLSAHIWATRADMSRDEITILWRLRSFQSRLHDSSMQNE